MATDSYDGRRPSLGLGHNGMYVRGFRSKPGAPMADPTQNIGAVGNGRSSLSSNWDSIFRNTASNKFGADGSNPKYFSSFPDASSPGAAGPTGAEDPEELQSAGFVPGMPANYKPPVNFSGTAPSHAQAWSAPPPRRTDDSFPAAPFMPKGPGVPFNVPKPLTGPTGTPAMDRANLERDRAMIAPGGAAGLWGTPKTYSPGWQTSNSLRSTPGTNSMREVTGLPSGDFAYSFAWKSAFK